MATAGSTIPWLAHKLTTTNLVSEENGRSMKPSTTSWHIDIGQHWCRFWGTMEKCGLKMLSSIFIHIDRTKNQAKKGSNLMVCFPLGQISSSVFQSLILSLDHPENWTTIPATRNSQGKKQKNWGPYQNAPVLWYTQDVIGTNMTTHDHGWNANTSEVKGSQGLSQELKGLADPINGWN